MTFLEGSQMESLNESFVRSGYVPWQNTSAKSVASRLRLIFQTLDRYALENVEPNPSLDRAQSQKRAKEMDTRPPDVSIGGTSGRTTSRPGQGRSEPQKQDIAEPEGPGSSKKRRKCLTGGPAGASSSGSALTTVSAGPTSLAAPLPDFEKFAVIQRNFWAEHKQCFLFEDLSVKVNIAQCILAYPQYVIRTLQRDIVDTVKKELIQLIDVKQRQKVCLTPVDSRNRFLKIKPERWEDIKDGRFMIINGQHSIIASQELQNGGCGDARKVELQTWDAYIVWSLDHNKLRSISKFYNCTNHLDHAQPTCGNQMISCRNIWKAYKRPTDCRSEASTRNNEAVFHMSNYKVHHIHLMFSLTRYVIALTKFCDLNCSIILGSRIIDCPQCFIN